MTDPHYITIWRAQNLLNHYGLGPESEPVVSMARGEMVEWSGHSRDSTKFVELLLQYGVSPYLIAAGLPYYNRQHPRVGFKDIPLRAMVQLPDVLLAYVYMYEFAHRGDLALQFQTVADEFPDAPLFYEKCRKDITILQSLEIRKNITMFTIAYKTGRELIHLTNEDCKKIEGYIDRHLKRISFSPYYRKAIQEHMEQASLMARCRDKAMTVIATSTQLLTPDLILDKIIGYLSYEELLKFQ